MVWVVWSNGIFMKLFTKTKLELLMSAKRNEIPFQNRKKFDIEIADYFYAIKKAENHGDEKKMMKLFNGWLLRLSILKSESECYKAPPALVRRDGETQEEYLNRCYAAMKGR